METAKFGPSSKNLDVRPPLHSNLRHLLVLLKESLLCLSPGGSDQPCSLLLGFSFRLEAHQLAKTPRHCHDDGQWSGCRSGWLALPLLQQIASQVHHLDYSDWTELSMLVSVCKICHDLCMGTIWPSYQQRRFRWQQPRSVLLRILQWLLR